MTLPKKPRIRRDWKAAEVKRGSVCRACERTESQLAAMGRRIELAHVIGREHDFEPAIGYEEIPITRSNLFVAPTRVIPLCGPATTTSTCHGKQHSRRLDLLPLLTRDEAIQAVADCDGKIETARNRLIGRES